MAKLPDQVRIKAKELEANIYGSSNIPQDYGLCSKCEYFYFRRTKLMDIETKCKEYQDDGSRKLKVQPRQYDPVMDCTGFEQRGQLSLNQMFAIAHIIDIRRNKIGFSGKEEIEVNITEPKETTDDIF